MADTVRLRKRTPGSAPGDYEWTSANQVVEVPRELAADLLAIPDGDFEEVLADGQEPTAPTFYPPSTNEPPPGDKVRTEELPVGGPDKPEDPIEVERLTPGEDSRGTHESDPTVPDLDAVVVDELERHGVPQPGGPIPVADHQQPLPTRKADLAQLARDLGLDDKGSVKDLQERIAAFRASEPPGDRITHGEKTPVTEPDPDAHK